LRDFVLLVQHSSVAEAIGKPHPSYSPEEKARSREISPTYSSDASNACTPRRGGRPAICPVPCAHPCGKPENAVVMAVVEEWDADYGMKIVYRREDVEQYRPPTARQHYALPKTAGTAWYGSCGIRSKRLAAAIWRVCTSGCCDLESGLPLCHLHASAHSKHCLARRWVLQQVHGESILAQ